jgi:hypothetical protein
MDKDRELRDRLERLIRQGSAFRPLKDLMANMPYENTGQQVEGFAHTIWELTEHLRLALHDLVEYSKDSHYHSPPWPDGYWPENTGPSSQKEWLETLEQIDSLTEEMISLVQDPSNDLFEPFSANKEHNLLRQATIAAEHNAYHGGQIAMLNGAINRMQK